MAGAWQLRKSGEPLLHGVAGKRKPITFVEDNAIPVEWLGEFVREMKAIVARHGTWAAFYAHASVGVLHVRPLIDIHDEADRTAMRAIAVETADLAQRLGGVMSGEHGDGRVRGPLLERFYGARLMQAFREVKGIFDPRNLLNPGNIIEPGPIESITLNLRVAPAGVPTPRVDDAPTFFDYDGHGSHGGLSGEVELCNGAGVCRKKQGGTMCPSYMATLDERHSTRGRGNALRLAITGQFGVVQGVQGRVPQQCRCGPAQGRIPGAIPPAARHAAAHTPAGGGEDAQPGRGGVARDGQLVQHESSHASADQSIARSRCATVAAQV